MGNLHIRSHKINKQPLPFDLRNSGQSCTIESRHATSVVIQVVNRESGSSTSALVKDTRPTDFDVESSHRPKG